MTWFAALILLGATAWGTPTAAQTVTPRNCGVGPQQCGGGAPAAGCGSCSGGPVAPLVAGHEAPPVAAMLHLPGFAVYALGDSLETWTSWSSAARARGHRVTGLPAGFTQSHSRFVVVRGRELHHYGDDGGLTVFPRPSGTCDAGPATCARARRASSDPRWDGGAILDADVGCFCRASAAEALPV